MIALATGVLVFISLVGTLIAAVSKDMEKLLWGTILCSLGLGLAVLLTGGGYFGILMIITFLITDLILYLYFRSQDVFVKKKIIRKNLQWMNKVAMIWLGLCGFLLFTGAVQNFFETNANEGIATQPLAELHQRIWGEDWYLIFLAAMILVLITYGGLFLVRRDKE